jgi:predicted dehydrogenase
MRDMERRDFIKGSAAAAVGLTLAPARVLGANDRIVAGFIGVGRQGQGNMNSFLKAENVAIAAVCDVYEPNLEKAAAIAGPGAAKMKDFRQVLDNKDINAVVISTPDHWHAYQTVAACQAGKDVYVEKPICVAVQEGRTMVEAARRYERVVQAGTQQRSGVHFQKAVELVRSGRLGKISVVRTWNFGNQSPEGIGNPPDSDPPSGLDWDLWLGPAPKRPFNPNRFGVNEGNFSFFRWFWDYAGGMMTDWGIHLLDIVQWAMDVDAPQAVTASGGKLFLKDNRETPDTLQVTYEYPGWIAMYENRELNANPLLGKSYGILFHGTDGTLFVDRNGYELIPETRGRGAAAVNRTEPVADKNSNNHSVAHFANFVECVRSRKRPVCDIETGHRSTSTCLLGNVAYRSRQRIEWDAKAEKITNAADARRYLSREYRTPWRLHV